MSRHSEATADLSPASPAQPGAEEPRANGATGLPAPFPYFGGKSRIAPALDLPWRPAHLRRPVRGTLAIPRAINRGGFCCNGVGSL